MTRVRLRDRLHDEWVHRVADAAHALRQRAKTGDVQRRRHRWWLTSKATTSVLCGRYRGGYLCWGTPGRPGCDPCIAATWGWHHVHSMDAPNPMAGETLAVAWRGWHVHRYSDQNY